MISHVLDATVPGSELIKILSGLSDSPQNQQEWLKLALDTALDFMPGGKIFKFLKGPSAKLGIKKVKKILMKEAKRTAKQTARQEVRKQINEGKSTSKEWNGKYKKKKPGISSKEGAKDPPSWAKEHRPRVGESGKEFAKRVMDEKYGPRNHPEGADTEFSKIQKWADRSFE